MSAFTVRDGLVVFSDNRPANEAGLRAPDGRALQFRGDLSVFSDERRDYNWAFEYGGPVEDGAYFTFTSADRSVTGQVVDGQIRVVNPANIILPPIQPRPRDDSSVRVLAIFPGVQSPGAGWGSLSHARANNESAYMAHGMSYVSSYLKSRGHRVWLLDTRSCQGWEHFIAEVRRQDYDVAMIGPLSIEAFTTACIVRVLKEEHPTKPVIVGGLHVSMTHDKVFPPDDLPRYYFYQEPPSRMREFLDLKGEQTYDPDRWPRADYVVWNEGELATAAIIEGTDLRGGSWDYEQMPRGTHFLNGKIVPDLNEMPHMDRNLFNEDMEKQHPLLPELPAPFHTITFGRGCPYKCSFCSVGEQFSSTKVRLIDPGYFMEELHQIKQSNGGHIGSLMVHDDILLFPKWLWDWNDRIKREFGYIPYWCQIRADFIVNHPDLIRHMAGAGMTWVSVGYEVGHARGLNGIMNKDLKVIGMNDPVEINIRASETLRQNGINSFGNFMFGNPTESNEEMDATVRMIQRIQPQHQGFSTYCDYPGTALSRLVDAEGLRMQEWYTRSHYPWQYRIKGVDYEHVSRCIQIASQTPRVYLNPKQVGLG